MQGNNQPDHRLPPRLFATDRFPSGRHNIYSKPELLAFIRHVLRDTEEFKYIRSSCFGKLFDLPARQCPSSGKMIHAMLTRQLVCGDKHTLWSVFGSDPIKFGLQEFGTITGLPCGAFPVGYTLDKEDHSTANKDLDWIKLIGKKRFTTIADLRHKLETDRHMPGRKKLQLALIIIVDGVLIAHQQTPRPTLKYVRMVQDVDAFCSHPWGRESFIKTIACMKPPKFVPLKCEDPIGAMVQLLKQETLRLRGFPLALQLLAYQAVPKLQSTIPIPFDSHTIMDLDGPNLPFYPAPSTIDIIRVEADPDLQVTSLIPIHSQPQPGWGAWPDVSNDDRVSYMEQLIADHRPFTKDLWHGGVTSEPFITTTTNDEDQPKAKKTKPEAPPKNAYKPKTLTKKVLKARKTSKKKDTVRKQRRISCYFHSAAPSSTSEDKILELLSAISDQVSKLQKESKLLRKLLKHKKTTTSLKRSAFNTLLGEGLVKKGNTSVAHKGCQTEATNVNVPVSSHDVCHTEPKADSSHHTLQALMEEDHSHSPVVSQYAAQLYGSTSHSKSTTGFVGHATAINAFSATATSKPSSVPNTQHFSAVQAQPTDDSDIVSLSDGSPAPQTPKHIPSMEEDHIGKQLLCCKTVPAPDLLSPLPQIVWDLFEKIISKFSAAFHITPSKLDFSNNFLLQLAQPMNWTTTYHMEILMHMLDAKYSCLFEEQKLVFITPHHTSGIQAISKDFNKSRKRDTFAWDDQLTGLVLQPGKKWMEDVLTVYTPMIWGDKHRVGLAINLDLGVVEVLDPLPTLYKDSTAGRFMAPVLKALPYLVKKVVNYQLTQFRGLAPFTWHRIKDLYINERGGDCGPVTAKFLEMHAHGDPANMLSITDRDVDDFRKQFVLDIYKTIVLPAYYPPA
ncbi:uncharacterized protein LOC125590558 [Brassica napus]|uniref:uncharacterized protein LOC125590558 n=1 Tax=Brassica napus TaxID=3708 RepID=UPI00207AB961|nr:uncharacterized protein LOC125590558 [Brassica napus]